MNNIADENTPTNNVGNEKPNENNNNNNVLKEVTSLPPPTLQQQDALNSNNNIENNNNNNNNVQQEVNSNNTTTLSPDSNGAQNTNNNSTTTTTTTTNNSNNNNNNNNVVKAKPPTKTSFKITEFSKRDKPFYTESRSLLDLTWRVYIFPRGNTSDKDLALFLDLHEVSQIGFPDIKAHFTLEVVNQKNAENNIRKPSEHLFNPKGVDWGFNRFMEISQLNDPESGFCVDDTVIINVEVVQAFPCSGMPMYDSKKVTGYVGLQNQGATCYMNSLLQSLFHISPFRRAVYELPTNSDEPTKSISLALQIIFYKLQFGDKAVPTKELTKSFGWDTMDIFTQHDVQELNRVLCDNLNDKMKGTKVEGTIDNLFRGKIKNFIKCEKINYESKSDEYFYDLSLNVKGCRDIISSFDKYTETERLDGSNQYYAEGYGLQNANKGVKFLSLPPVLNLHLKRFEYDPIRDENVKINDKYKFPENLDLNRYMDESADKSMLYYYTLQGVLVHSGDLHNGHYYAFIKNKDGDWLKFDDDEVTKSSFERVSDASFGSDFGVRAGKSDTNAYMLVYFRNNEYDLLTQPILENEIPEHLKFRIEKDEQRENEQTFQVRITRDEDFADHDSFDLIDFERFPPKLFKKTHDNMNLGHLKKQITTLFGIPVERQRIWIWTTRRNKTQRIEKFPESDDTTIQNIRIRLGGEIRIHLEICFNPRSSNSLIGGSTTNTNLSNNIQQNNINNQQQQQQQQQQQNNFNQQLQQQQHLPDNYSFFPKISKDGNALFFFKYYDPETQTLKFLDSKVIDLNAKASSTFPFLCLLAKLPPDTPLLVFEEITSTKINPIKPNETFFKMDMMSGDIIVFQKQNSTQNKYKLPTASDYYNYIINTSIVTIKQVDNSKISFSCELPKQMKYSEITQKIASTINANAENIRLMSKTLDSQITPIKPNDNIPLYDMLTSSHKLTDVLYFEILKIPVKECEFKRNFKITWQKPNSNETEIISVWIQKLGDVKQLMNEFLLQVKQNYQQQQQQKAKNLEQQQQQNNDVIIKDQEQEQQNNEQINIENLDISRIRLLEIRSSRIDKILTDEFVSSISEISQLRAEVISDEEMNLNKGEKVVFVVHYSREHNYQLYHGTPFTVIYKPGETCQQLRARIFPKLGGSISNKEFSRWKLSIIKDDNKIEYIPEDTTLLGPINQTQDYNPSSFLIGLEHPNTHKSHHQKAIKILG